MDSLATASPEKKDIRSDGREDPFLKSLAALKEILAIDSPTKKLLSKDMHQRQDVQQLAQESPSNKEVTPPSYQKLQLEEYKGKLQLIEKELTDTKARAERERTLRLSLEAVNEKNLEHHKLLNKQLEDAVAEKKPLLDEIINLKSQIKVKEEKIQNLIQTHKEELDVVTQEKHLALTNGDKMEARLRSAEQEAKEWREKLEASQAMAVATKDRHQQSLETSEKIIQGQRKSLDSTRNELSKLKEELAKCKALLEAANKENEELRQKSSETAQTESVRDKPQKSESSKEDPQTEIQVNHEMGVNHLKFSPPKEGESDPSEVVRLGDEEKQSISVEEPNKTILQSRNESSMHSPPKRDAEEAKVAEIEPDAKKIKESPSEDFDGQADVADV